MTLYYAKLDNKYMHAVQFPIYEKALKTLFPGYLFPLEANKAANIRKNGFSIPPYYVSVVPRAEKITGYPENAVRVEAPPSMHYLTGEWEENYIMVDTSIPEDALLAKEKERLKILLKRNQLLDRTDRYVTADLWESYSEQEKTEWRTFRQALRDLDYHAEDPTKIVWPSPPITFGT